MTHFPFLSCAAALVLGCLPAAAELQWYGDPAKGRQVFDNLNFEGAVKHSAGSGSIKPDKDPELGPIWRIHKPAADKRAEIRGAAGWSFHHGKGGVMKQGVTYYIGWRYKFEMPDKKTGGWACFQWKSYPLPGSPEADFNQNYPLTMGYDGRDLSLTSHAADWTHKRSGVVRLWSAPVKIGTWVSVVLAIRPSRDAKTGCVEIWLDGEKQKLATGGTRFFGKTMDGSEVAPKWGAYNRNAVGTEIDVCLADLRIATDLKSAMPEPLAKRAKKQ